MGKFNEWQRAKNKVKAAEAWLENRNKIDSQDGKRYELKTVISSGTFQFCGQAYAGANNYHGMPEELVDAVRVAIRKRTDSIFADALRILEEEVVCLGQLAKSEVEAMLEEISTASDKSS